MKAIILSSGPGSRLRPYTDDLPKSLLRINAGTVIDLEIQSLMACGIEDIIITTGHEHEKLERHVLTNYPDPSIAFIRNERYDTTNYIYSIWLTRGWIEEDVVLLHGDMVFETCLLERLVQDSAENGVLVNRLITPPQKDFKALVENETVREIGTDLSGQNAFFCAPVYKFSRSSFLTWLAEIGSFVDDGNVRCYAEDALNAISHEIGLRPVYYTNEFCMEIDTPEDLATARAFYAGKERW